MQLNASLLIVGVIGVLFPGAFGNAVHPTQEDPLTDAQEGHDILSISHGVHSHFPGELPYEADSSSTRLLSSYLSASLLSMPKPLCRNFCAFSFSMLPDISTCITQDFIR